MSVGWGQGCIDGVEVELWDECYNIEETDSLQLSFTSGISGPIPSEIGSLTELSDLNLYANQLAGSISAASPATLCFQ